MSHKYIAQTLTKNLSFLPCTAYSGGISELHYKWIMYSVSLSVAKCDVEAKAHKSEDDSGKRESVERSDYEQRKGCGQ